MAEPRSVEIPPIALAGLWSLSDVKTLVSRAKRAWQKERFAEAAKICAEISKVSRKAQQLLSESAEQFRKLQEGVIAVKDLSQVKVSNDGKRWEVDGKFGPSS